MPQYARPVRDITVAGWTPTPLWDQIDEAVANDADSIGSPSNPANVTCEVGLSAISRPQSGSHVVRVRHVKIGARTATITAALYQGSTLIASTGALTVNTAHGTATRTLTAGEVAAITDYSNLLLRLTANTTGGGSGTVVYVTWAELEVPDPVPMTQVTRTAQLGWDVRSQVARFAATGWHLLAQTSRSAPLAWSIRSPLVRVADLCWSVLTPVTAEAELAWHTWATVAAIAPITWAVDASGQVTVVFPMAWDIRQGVAQEVGLAWEVRTPAVRFAILEWEVSTEVTRAVPLTWDIRAMVERLAALEWKIRGQIGVSAHLAWAIDQSPLQVTAVVTLGWSVRTPVEAMAALAWAVRQSVGTVAPLAWIVQVQIRHAGHGRVTVSPNMARASPVSAPVIIDIHRPITIVHTETGPRRGNDD